METMDENTAYMLISSLGVELLVKKTVKELIVGYDDQILYTASIFAPDQVKTSKFSIMNGVVIYFFTNN